MIYINTFTESTPEVPFGGVKNSATAGSSRSSGRGRS
jgi:acyl-CoA reductase-like NAD-dependent aldehyde dehydrogenase